MRYLARALISTAVTVSLSLALLGRVTVYLVPAIILSLVADALQQYKLPDEEVGSFSFIEHYHIGLLLMFLGVYDKKPFYFVLAIYFFVNEALQDNPYGFGKPNLKYSLAFGLILLVATLLKITLELLLKGTV